MPFVNALWTFMAMNKTIHVKVAYATSHQQHIISMEIEAGNTIETAIQRSGILALFPEIDLAKQKVGVFSKPRKLSNLVAEGDRIEIYRPLTVDPKEARRKKAGLIYPCISLSTP